MDSEPTKSRYSSMRWLWGYLALVLIASPAASEILQKQKILNEQSFWDNRDWDWYKANIPFFDSPDSEINAIYYYRWELLTKHLTYGSTLSGYSFTEFIDRPFWSGSYGSIVVPAGHQLYEARWLRQGRVPWDYARYWYRTPGAEPRRMSGWIADATWAVHLVHENAPALRQILPAVRKNYEGWEAEHFDADVGLFWQTGHDDGMEFNINSRQTTDILHGGLGYRPTLNSYLWADAIAIAKIAALAGDTNTAGIYNNKAARLKSQVQNRLWDPARKFFYPMAKKDEVLDGYTVLSKSLTYQTGKFAGNTHGRELIGFIPWQFNLPDPNKGFEAAWAVVMQRDYFFGEFGPTTLERNDPQFLLQKNWCCWWSGQSWPYATTQTLKAMANVLQNYQQNVISAGDYYKMFQAYTRGHRKSGIPYIAEALDPDTGSFEGHDAFNHSEHYFHSGFVDLVITGLVGLKPRADNTLELKPLAPSQWDYFALEDVSYHGRLLTILWDRDGHRYGKGVGFSVFVDGMKIASQPKLSEMAVQIPPKKNLSISSSGSLTKTTEWFNFAVNNDGNYYPRIYASVEGQGEIEKLIDGNYWYHLSPPNRWTAAGSKNTTDWLMIDFGRARKISTLKFYFLDDGDKILPPTSLQVEYSVNGRWSQFRSVTTCPDHPMGKMSNTVNFAPTLMDKFRITLEHPAKGKSGLTEIEAWGLATSVTSPEQGPIANLALQNGQTEFPKALASFTSRFDQLSEVHDGRIVFTEKPHNRWTSFGSPNETDWLDIDFGARKSVSRVEIAFYDDGVGVRPPRQYSLQTWQAGNWRAIENVVKMPSIPAGHRINVATFAPTSTSQIRVNFQHQNGAKTGLSEILIWPQ